MSTEIDRSDTLKVRMDQATLSMLDTARAYLKLDKSKFIRQSVREKAAAIIAEYQTTRFTPADWRVFFNRLEKPGKPTSRMRRAAGALRAIEKE